MLAHREGTVAETPEFLNTVRLPGEEDIVAQIDAAETQLAGLRDRRDELVRWKLLIAHLAGTALEREIINALNVVLAGSGLEARDVAEEFAQDFDIIEIETEQRVALGEAKAERGGISLANVNQINNFRVALDLTSEEAPGLVVVNAFRNDSDLERRPEQVPDRVARQASGMNVLALRTWDLFELVRRRLNGEDDSATLSAALAGGGGWLEATDDEVTIHTG